MKFNRRLLFGLMIATLGLFTKVAPASAEQWYFWVKMILMRSFKSYLYRKTNTNGDTLILVKVLHLVRKRRWFGIHPLILKAVLNGSKQNLATVKKANRHNSTFVRI